MTVLNRNPQNTNFLQPTKFILTFDRISDTQYFCQEANIPGVSMGAATVPTPVLDYRLAGNKLTFNEFNITFIIDEEGQSYRDIYKWFLSFASPSMDERNALREASGSKTNYDDAILTILSSLNNPVIRVQYHNLFPISLSDIQFNTTESADTIMTATATFAFEYYEFLPVK